MRWTEKYLKKQEYVNINDEKLFVRNYFSKCLEVATLTDYLCYQLHESLSCEVFSSKTFTKLQSTWSGQDSASLVYYAYLIFFYENHWPHLFSSSKCREAWNMAI